MNQGQSKGGTGRAYLSTIQDHFGDCRDGQSGPSYAPHLRRHGTVYASGDDTAELARILGDTEPEGEETALVTIPDAAYDCRAFVWEAMDALAERLAAVTADGGPLDSLTADALIQYEPTLCTDPSFNTVCGMATRNGFRDRALFRGADPVILAAQLDLAVLSAYAQQPVRQ